MLKDIDLSSTPVNLEVATRTKKDDRARIFFGGPIITMTDGFFSPVEALVVEEDTIKYTGTLQGAKDAAGEEAIVYDLQERCLVPGSVEPHLHLILSAVTDHYFLKLSPNEVTTVDKALEIIRGAIGEGNLVGGKMVVGYGYDPSRVEETDNYPAHSDLTKEMLDKISTKYPIYIINQSGHVAYASTLTLENAGVTKDSVKDDESYQKDDKGELTGVIYEQALARIGKQVPQLTADLVFDYCNRTIRKWSSRGCTTVFDAGIGSVGPTDMVLLANLPKPDIRFYGALSVNAVPAYLAPIIRQPPFKLGPVEVIAIKYWADGSTQGFTAAVYTPYVNPPSKEKEHGTLNYESAEVLAGVIEPYLREGFQIVVHSNGDRATNQVLDTYEAVFEANPNRDKKIIHRIEHFTVTESTQLTRAARLGLGISQTIGHVSGWGETFNGYVLKPRIAKRIDPLHSDEKAGLLWSLHSDSPVTEVQPLQYLQTATTREMIPSGKILGPEECVELEPALRGITLNPAKQIGVSHLVGSLEPGKKADMVILDKDPRKVPKKELNKLVVLETWSGGNKIYDSRG